MSLMMANHPSEVVSCEINVCSLKTGQGMGSPVLKEASKFLSGIIINQKHL